MVHTHGLMEQITRLNSSQRMADALLDGKLIERLTEWKARGLGAESIAKELHAATGGAVNVSYQTVYRWLETLKIEVAS